MPSRRCPHCKARTSYEANHGGAQALFSREPSRYIRLDVCREESCGCAIAVVTNQEGNELEIFPPPGEEPDELLPDGVRIALSQALRSLNEGIWDGCVLMARRALEEAMADLKAEGKDLYHKIEYLAANNRITPDLKEWAHEGRLGGKLGAHGKAEGDEKQWNDATDAEEIVEFCRWFFRYVYILPKQLEQRRGRLMPTQAANETQ